MLPKILQLYLFLLANCFQYGATVPSRYESKQSQLLPATHSDNEGYTAEQSVYNGYTFYEQNLPGNSNYQTLYPYYYTPPYETQQQEQQQQQQPRQLWSGLPIVIEDNIQQQQQTSTNIPPIFYEQQSTGVVGELLPFRHTNSPHVITPTIYNPQSTTRTATQFNFNNHHNNNNNNIIYHRDIRHHIDATPPQSQSQQTQQQNIISLNNQQQKQQQQQHHQLFEEQQQQQEEDQAEQFYANINTNTNLHCNGISNDSNSLRKDNNKSVYYREQFKQYLENNPHRIKPVYQ